MRQGAFRPGQRLARAAVRQPKAAIICYGKRGRLLRCRAVTDDEGTLVGYQAFDTLSRELGGTPLYALYDATGRRYGYARAGEAVHVCAGEPEQGFFTAPDSIPV